MLDRIPPLPLKLVPNAQLAVAAQLRQRLLALRPLSPMSPKAPAKVHIPTGNPPRLLLQPKQHAPLGTIDPLALLVWFVLPAHLAAATLPPEAQLELPQ